MKIGIVSDSHDNIPLLCAAVEQAQRSGAETILHCGDIVSANTLRKLRAYHLPIHVIHGNNLGDLYYLTLLATNTNNAIRYYGQDADIKLAGKRIFLVHFPHYAQAMAKTGDYDLVCCGHDHRANIQLIHNIKEKTTVLCNPGTVGGIDAPATYILGDLSTMEFTIFPVI